MFLLIQEAFIIVLLIPVIITTNKAKPDPPLPCSVGVPHRVTMALAKSEHFPHFTKGEPLIDQDEENPTFCKIRVNLDSKKDPSCVGKIDQECRNLCATLDCG